MGTVSPETSHQSFNKDEVEPSTHSPWLAVRSKISSGDLHSRLLIKTVWPTSIEGVQKGGETSSTTPQGDLGFRVSAIM